MRGLVHEALDQKGALGPPRPAIGAGGRRGGDSAGDLDVRGGHDIGARQCAARIPRRPGAAHREAPSQREADARPHAADDPVGAHRELRVGRHAASLLGGHHVLVARGHPLHRPAQPQRQPGHQDVLAIRRALDAEAAAYLGRHHADARLGKAQRARQLRAHAERRLGRGPHPQLIRAGIEPRQRRPRLHGDAGQPRLDRANGDHVSCAAEGCLRVTRRASDG